MGGLVNRGREGWMREGIKSLLCSATPEESSIFSCVHMCMFICVYHMFNVF